MLHPLQHPHRPRPSRTRYFHTIYDATGKLIGEYSTIVESSTNAKVNYLTTDHLGSPRVNTDATSSVVARHDYHPFGEEIAATGSRSSVGYYGDNVRKQFTGYERDSETSSDFAEARMYNYAIGRFSAVDSGAFTPSDPQSWNRYAMVQNNPLKFIDPSGNDLVLTGNDADYLVGELSNASGLKLRRCDAVDSKSGCKKIGQVLVTGIIEKSARKKSRNLASKLIEIIGDSAATVSIKTGRNEPRVLVDSYDRKLFDVADYDTAKKVDPNFALTFVSHVLEEYYQSETTFSKEADDDRFFKSHEKGKEFESKVLSDFTDQPEQKRSGKFDLQKKTASWVYTSVQYDVVLKSGLGKDKSLSNFRSIIKKTP